MKIWILFCCGGNNILLQLAIGFHLKIKFMYSHDHLISSAVYVYYIPLDYKKAFTINSL